MGQAKPVAGFVDGAYEGQSRVVTGEQCINMFPEVVPQGGKARSALVAAPGLPTFAEFTDAPGRGVFTHKGRLFTVYGRTLYEVAANGIPTALGAVAVDANPATFDSNGDGANQLLVTSGDKGYLLNLTTLVLTTPLASGSTQGGQVDGFFLSLNAATSTFQSSNSLDGATWSGLAVAQRTSASDPWKAMIVSRNEVYLYGDKTGEVWYNAGLPIFAFAQRPEGFFETGIAAAFSLARFNGSVAFLGRTEKGNPAVYWMDGYSPIQISNTAIEWVIQQYEEQYGVSDAIGWSYEREGHKFYVLHFPKPKKTWVYDATTNKWHRRGKWNLDAADFTQYRPVFQASCFGRNLVCDSDGNKMYSMSSTTYTDVGGAELRRLRRTPHMSSANRKIFFQSAELECDRGVGNDNDPGQNPLVHLRYANDGGYVFGDSRPREIGKVGAYGTRVRWEMCGAGRDRVWEVWQSDPNASRWFDLYVDATVGRN